MNNQYRYLVITVTPHRYDIVIIIYTMSQKGATIFLPLTLPNTD